LFTRIRVEDLLAASFGLALAGIAGVGAVLRGLHLDESTYWELTFILAPLAVLVFLASLRYAIAGGAPVLNETLREIGGTFRDWLPFLFFLMFYGAFHAQVWLVLNPEDRDAALLAWDLRLFGQTPAVFFDRFVHKPITDVLSVAYLSHLILPPLLAFAWYVRNRRIFREFLLAVLLSGVFGAIGYLLVPAVGPAIAFPHLFQHELNGIFYGPINDILDKVRAPRDVFPSLHVGISTIVLFYVARFSRRWLLVFLPFILGNWLSTLYLRCHYLVDVLAGWAVAVLVIVLAKQLIRTEERLRPPPSESVPGPPADAKASTAPQ
jgi:membrane-associated phospholipid phosphatase